MIVKERSFPMMALLDEILLRRLPKYYNKRPIIEEDLSMRKAGYWGEQRLDYYLSFLQNEKYFIFQDLRLTYEKWTFQIDFLLLSTSFALLIETKNYAGTLDFDSKFNQLIQTHKEKEKGYEDPIFQAQRQLRLLLKWMKTYTKVILPIEYLAVMSNPNSILRTAPTNTLILKKVCKPYKLIDKIEEIERIYQKEIIDMKALKNVNKLLLKHHTPEKINILHHYQIPKEDILTGINCPSCGAIPMEYIKGKWHCTLCNTYSKTAHIEGVNDYFFIIKDTITNIEFRDFLHLPTKDVSQKKLNSMNLPSTGNTKGRIYHQKKVK